MVWNGYTEVPLFVLPLHLASVRLRIASDLECLNLITINTRDIYPHLREEKTRNFREQRLLLKMGALRSLLAGL